MYLKVKTSNTKYIVIITILSIIIIFISLKLIFSGGSTESVDKYKKIELELNDKNRHLDSLISVYKDSIVKFEKKNYKLRVKLSNITAQLFYTNNALEKNIKTIDSLYHIHINIITSDSTKILNSNEIRNYINSEFFNNGR